MKNRLYVSFLSLLLLAQFSGVKPMERQNNRPNLVFLNQTFNIKNIRRKKPKKKAKKKVNKAKNKSRKQLKTEQNLNTEKRKWPKDARNNWKEQRKNKPKGKKNPYYKKNHVSFLNGKNAEHGYVCNYCNRYILYSHVGICIQGFHRVDPFKYISEQKLEDLYFDSPEDKQKYLKKYKSNYLSPIANLPTNNPSNNSWISNKGNENNVRQIITLLAANMFKQSSNKNTQKTNRNLKRKAKNNVKPTIAPFVPQNNRIKPHDYSLPYFLQKNHKRSQNQNNFLQQTNRNKTQSSGNNKNILGKRQRGQDPFENQRPYSPIVVNPITTVPFEHHLPVKKRRRFNAPNDW